MGWLPLIHENCTRMTEYEYQTAEQREANNLNLGGSYHIYSGGGYELRMKGQIKKLNNKIKTLQENNWIDNRTRALITEFSVYNAQANLFGVVKIVAEFVGGGISPVFRIDIIRLTRVMDLGGYIVTACELFFVFATFYYVLNTIATLKSLGPKNFFKDAWNMVDIVTIFFSLVVMGLWVIKNLEVIKLTKQIKRTGGNAFIPIEKTMQINSYYDYTVSFTVFTSMLKFCRLLSFQKAFKQIAATIKLCFIGLSTFVVEFVIVFGSFCCFFFFILSANLRNFLDINHTVQNTLAMAIGKFNFGALRAANEGAAWIFFAFSSKILFQNSKLYMFLLQLLST